MSEAQSFHQQDYQRPELVCPAGTPAALRAAVDAGADAACRTRPMRAIFPD
jgi:hypothetical protein